MDSRVTKDCIAALDEAGVEFIIPSPRGMFTGGPGDLLEFLRDGYFLFWAKHYGVTEEDMRIWLHAKSASIYGGGIAELQCSANTKSGRRCRRMVNLPSHVGDNPRAFAEAYRAGGYCALHDPR